MALSKRLRYEILRRDNHTCRYCGTTAPAVKITVDHVVPTALGGTDDPTNLVAACVDCNAGKSSSNPDAPLVTDVSQAALKWQAAINLAAALASRDRERLAPDVDDIAAYWQRIFGNYAEAIRPYPEPDARASIREWLARGVTREEMRELIDVTEAKFLRDRYLKTENVWRYFAGCCWNRVAERQAEAHRLIDTGEV